MEELIEEFQAKRVGFSAPFKRSLYDTIDVKNKLIAIKGARGTGKTTLLLQLAIHKLNTDKTLYVSLDHLYFYDNNLYDLAKQFEQHGGTYLLIDEVHKYPNWSREIKLIYDNLPKLSVLFTSSSVLELYKSESDLSRRMVSYDLNELSFREFITLETGHELPIYAFSDVLKNHQEIAVEIVKKIRPLPLFQKYLKMGSFPYYKENESVYYQKVMRTINQMIEVDIVAVENLRYETTIKIKKLLKAIATSVPFTPNITSLSEKVKLSRNSLLEALKTLNKAGIIHELYKDTTGIGALTKPEKLFLHNSNYIHILGDEKANIGNVRETFFVNQVSFLHEVNLHPKADFLVDQKWIVVVGGKSKKQKQIQGIENAFIGKDDIEIGFGNVVPLWLFGMMY